MILDEEARKFSQSLSCLQLQLWLESQSNEEVFWTDRFRFASLGVDWYSLILSFWSMNDNQSDCCRVFREIYVYCSFGEDGELGFRIKSDQDRFCPCPMECRILLIDQYSPESSYKIGKPSFHCRRITVNDKNQLCEKNQTVILKMIAIRCPCFVTNPFAEGRRQYFSDASLFEESRKIDVRSFMLDGWLKLGLRLSYIRGGKEYVQNIYSWKGRVVRIQVVKDQVIRKNVASNASADVFGIPTGYIIPFLPTSTPKDVKDKVCS